MCFKSESKRRTAAEPEEEVEVMADSEVKVDRTRRKRLEL